MKNIQLILMAAIFCMAGIPAAFAQDYSRYLEAVTQLNRINPLQNPEYESADKILKRRILDRKNKVIGQVKDVIINDNGSLASLEVDFDRLRLEGEVFVNYRDMGVRPATNSYMISFADEQIEDMYPTLLAEMETASGEDEDAFSLRRLLGASVKAYDGRKLGVVEDVLFSANGGRAEALYISLKGYNLRGETLAIPLSMAEIEDRGFGKGIVLGDEQADAIIDYAEEN